MECFTADFLQFCSTAVEICFLGGRLSTFSSIPSISRIFLKFTKFLRSLAVSRLATREATRYSPFGDNNLVPFHLR